MEGYSRGCKPIGRALHERVDEGFILKPMAIEPVSLEEIRAKQRRNFNETEIPRKRPTTKSSTSPGWVHPDGRADSMLRAAAEGSECAVAMLTSERNVKNVTCAFERPYSRLQTAHRSIRNRTLGESARETVQGRG